MTAPSRGARPLNVVRVISHLKVGGVQRMLLATLPLIDSARFRVSVCCTGRAGDLAPALEAAGIPVHVVPIRGRLQPSGLWRLSRWLRSTGADIVHTHMYASNISGVLAARMAGVPTIISHIHADHEWRSPSRERTDRFCDRFRSGYVAVSGSVRDALVRHAGLKDPARVRVIHNVPSPLADPGTTPDALRAELGIPAGAPVFGTIGRLVPVKGLEVFLRAARRIAEEVPEARFVLVGRGPLEESLAGEASALGLGGRVVFAGQRLDVAAFYRMFSAFLLSSRTEGCPNVVLEAMQMGCPVVATNVGGVPELVRGESGLLVPRGDAEALAAAALRLVREPELAERQIAAGRVEAARMSLAGYVDQIHELYEDLHRAGGEAGAAVRPRQIPA